MQKQKAFTLVEIMIAVAIVGIISGLVLINNIGGQKRAMETAVKADVQAASNEIKTHLLLNNAYPASLPTTFKPSTNVQISYLAPQTSSSTPTYTSEQNALLFLNFCRANLPNSFYWTQCNHYDSGGVQLTGNTGYYLNSPISESSLLNAGCTGGTDSYNVTYCNSSKEFTAKVDSQFTAKGGTFPITMPASLSGVTLPRLEYCINGISFRYSDIRYTYSPSAGLQPGQCS